MPVAVAQIDWDGRALAGQLALQSGDQGPILVVDRALSAEVIVVLGGLRHSLPGNVPAAQHVLQERDDIFPLVGSTERNDDERIVSRRAGVIHRGIGSRGTGY